MTRDTWGPPSDGWPTFGPDGKVCTGTGRICEPRINQDACAKCDRTGLDAVAERKRKVPDVAGRDVAQRCDQCGCPLFAGEDVRTGHDSSCLYRRMAERGMATSVTFDA